MDGQVKKILFIGLSGIVRKGISFEFASEHFLSYFSEIADSLLSIKKVNPDIIISGISLSDENFNGKITNLTTISEEMKIPFSLIICSGRDDCFIYLINNGISQLITVPPFNNNLMVILKSLIPENLYDNLLSEIAGHIIYGLVDRNRIIKEQIDFICSRTSQQTNNSDKYYEVREMERKLWNALDKKYFQLFYQPVLSLVTDSVTGFEALIRLIDPVEGLIMPDRFISIAETSAIIFPLGLWIIEEACRQISEWKKKYIFDTPIRINVNLSAKQFIHPDLTKHIFEITEKYGIESDDIGFELTESAFMEDMESANIVLLELRSKKFCLYMDDFGTGYSSLSYLMHFPVNVIKIDQSFVKWMHIDESSETIVKSIVSLAHNLGLKVVAEGTDDESHITILKECGCDFTQGYLFSKPVPPDRAEEFLVRQFKIKQDLSF